MTRRRHVAPSRWYDARVRQQRLLTLQGKIYVARLAIVHCIAANRHEADTRPRPSRTEPNRGLKSPAEASSGLTFWESSDETPVPAFRAFSTYCDTYPA